MTIGDEIEFFDALDKYSDAMKDKSDSAINFQYVQMPRDNHSTTPYLSTFNGLRFIFFDWVLPVETYQEGLEAIDQHYANVSKSIIIRLKLMKSQ